MDIEEVVRISALAADITTTFLRVLKEDIIPLIRHLKTAINSVIQKLSAKREKAAASALLNKLISCRELTQNLLGLAQMYVTTVRKYITYAQHEGQVSEMKRAYKMFIDFNDDDAEPLGTAQSVGAVTFIGVAISYFLTGSLSVGLTLAGGIGLVTVAAPPMMIYYKKTQRRSVQKEFKKLQSYLRCLSDYCQLIAESYRLFEIDCGRVKAECREAFTLCEEVISSLEKKKTRTKVIGGTAGTVAATAGVVGATAVGAGICVGAVVAVEVLTLGVATPVVAALAAGGGAAAIAGTSAAIGTGIVSVKLVKHYNRIAEEIEAICSEFTALHQKVHKCSTDMSSVEQKMRSLMDDRNMVDRHVANQDDYDSFIRVLDQMLCSVGQTQAALQNLQNTTELHTVSL